MYLSTCVKVLEQNNNNNNNNNNTVWLIYQRGFLAEIQTFAENP